MQKQPCVYIMSSRKNGTLYVGVTSDLIKRVWQHKHKMYTGFSEKYNTNMLVYYETHEQMDNAIVREKQIKKWQRQWKLRLIEVRNPDWHDLYDEIMGLV